MSLSKAVSLRVNFPGFHLGWPFLTGGTFYPGGSFPRASSSSAATPPPALKQLPHPAPQAGFFKYTRNWSRDKKYDLRHAPQKGDTPLGFFTRRLGHAYETYPIFFLLGIWFVGFCYTVYYSFDKVEIWLDRSKPEAPWDWSRIKDKYWKMNTVLGDLDGRTHQRLEIMEQLQDEMLEAAKKRGTRN